MIDFYDAFISYGRSDSKSFAAKLCERLQELGHRVWFDQKDIPVGVNFQQEIYEGIERSHNFIFVMSPHAVNSPYCRKEIEWAVKNNKRILPLLFIPEISFEKWMACYPDENAVGWAEYTSSQLQFGDERNPRLHEVIRLLNWINSRDCVDDFEEALGTLAEAIERQKDHFEEHTNFLVKALHWQTQQKRSQFLLVGKERERASQWLITRFEKEQLPCEPTDLQAEYITESLKNANNMMTQVFLCYASADQETMLNIQQRALWREGITVWTHIGDLSTGQKLNRVKH